MVVARGAAKVVHGCNNGGCTRCNNGGCTRYSLHQVQHCGEEYLTQASNYVQDFHEQSGKPVLCKYLLARRCCEMLCVVVQRCAMLCDVAWCSVMLCDAVRCCAMLCNLVWCCAMLCDVVWCCAMICDVVWCFAMFRAPEPTDRF